MKCFVGLFLILVGSGIATYVNPIINIGNIGIVLIMVGVNLLCFRIKEL